jgi:hypothetical protein
MICFSQDLSMISLVGPMPATRPSLCHASNFRDVRIITLSHLGQFHWPVMGYDGSYELARSPQVSFFCLKATEQ